MGSEYTIDIPKSGDMITAIRLVLSLPTTNILGEQIINKAEFLVGDTTLESITGEFLQVLNDFEYNLEKRQTYQTNLIGPLITLDIPFLAVKSGFQMVTVPSIRISLSKGFTVNEIRGYLLVDYSLIEDPPKSVFIQRTIQNQNIRGIFKGATLVKFDTAFVGPVFQLFFTAKVNGSFVDYIQNVKFVSDGQERFNLGKQYLKYVEPLKVYKSIPSRPICYYSFCVDPSKPSGSMNFSRIDTQRFDIELVPNTDQVQIDIWAQNHDFVHFNSSNCAPIFETREMFLNASQNQTLGALQDLPVTISYRYYTNSVSIFYHTDQNILITPLVVAVYPTNSSTSYGPGVVTLNNLFTDTYITLSFSAPGYNTVGCSLTVNIPISSYAYSVPLSGAYKNYSQASSFTIKTNQTINLFADGTGGALATGGLYNISTILNTGPSGKYICAADSVGMKNTVTSSIIDYDDSNYVAMMSNRNIYNSDGSRGGTATGGTLVKYDPSSNVNWVNNLTGTNPLLVYLYPRLVVASQVQQYLSAEAIITKVACREGSTLLLDNKGIVYYGGTNIRGEAGNSNLNVVTMGFYVPRQLVGTNLTFIDISLGGTNSYYKTTFLVDSNGGVWCSGSNEYGQLGLGDTTNRSSLTQVNLGNVRISKVSCGFFHTLLLDTTGNVWATGANYIGVLGIGSSAFQVNTFTKVPGSLQAIKISAGLQNSTYIDATGALWVTGPNFDGQLGTGGSPTYTISFIPSGLTGIVDVSFGANCIMAVSNTGAVYLAGSGYTNTFTNANTLGFTGTAQSVSYLSSNAAATYFIIDTTGAIWAKGVGTSGQCGTGAFATYDTFQKLTTGLFTLGQSITSANTVALPAMSMIVVTDTYSIAVDTTGKLWIVGGADTNLSARGFDMTRNTLPYFEKTKVLQQSTSTPTTINLSEIDRTTGRTVTSSNILGAGILNNISVDVNGKFYLDTIQNTTNSYPVLLSVDGTGLITGVPSLTGIQVGNYVTLSVIPAGFSSNTGQVSSLAGVGFRISSQVPTSAVSGIPTLVTVGQNINQGYTYQISPIFVVSPKSGPYGTKCLTYIDRFNNQYLAYVDTTSSTTTLKYGTWTVSVSNSPCRNCRIEVDYLGSIYFVGDYGYNSVITGGTNPSWSQNGGTFIMKLNSSGAIKWIIQIQNAISTDYTIVNKIGANPFSGSMQVAGNINSLLTSSASSNVVCSLGSTYTISVSGTGLSSPGFSNCIYGFEFIFDPSGNLNPKKTVVPPNDFFQVPYKYLIGLHPLSTFDSNQFYPPQYFSWPPFNLNNTTFSLLGSVTNTSSILLGTSWGDGTYQMTTSSVNDTIFPGIEFSGVRAFDYKNFTYWESGVGYDSGGINNMTTRYLTTATAAKVYGEYIQIQFPVSLKSSYVKIIEDYSVGYTYLGSIDGITWDIIFTADGSVTVQVASSAPNSYQYKVSDASKLYPGMTTGSLNIVSVDYTNKLVVLSGPYSGTSATFAQVPTKTLFLNTQVSYNYYAYSVQKVTAGQTRARVYTLIYYS